MQIFWYYYTRSEIILSENPYHGRREANGAGA